MKAFITTLLVVCMSLTPMMVPAVMASERAELEVIRSLASLQEKLTEARSLVSENPRQLDDFTSFMQSSIASLRKTNGDIPRIFANGSEAKIFQAGIEKAVKNLAGAKFLALTGNSKVETLAKLDKAIEAVEIMQKIDYVMENIAHLEIMIATYRPKVQPWIPEELEGQKKQLADLLKSLNSL